MQITPGFQEGKCSVCKKKKKVRVLVLGKKYAELCKDCLEKVGGMESSDFVKKYGKKSKDSKK